MSLKARAYVISTGLAIPQRVLTNQDLEGLVDTTDEWITERTGIKKRRILEDGEVISTYAVEAAKACLEKAKVSPEEIDLIICATLTPDSLMPSLGILIQRGLRAVNAGAFDLSATCSGFIYGLALAGSMVAARPNSKVLVVGAEALSRKTNWQDRTTCVLFGDGAGAVLVGQAPQDQPSRIIDFILGADGSNWELLTLKGGGSAFPPFDPRLPREDYYIRMQGKEVFKIAVRMMEKVVLELLERNNLTSEDIDLLIPHQANLRIIEYLRARLKLPHEKVMVNIHEYGNTSAASIPIALHEACTQGRLKRGDLVLMVAFGGGFTYGGILLRW